jgi:hypothetical protein
MPKKKNLLMDAIECERVLSQYVPTTSTNISRKRKLAEPVTTKISESRGILKQPLVEQRTRDRQESAEEGEIIAHPAYPPCSHPPPAQLHPT